MHDRRRSGILLHPTSLPGPDGSGTLGEEAFRFVDVLAAAGQTLWQILPLGPPGCGNSPYSCFSAFAGNPLLIDLRQVAADGDLELSDLQAFSHAGRIDFPAVTGYKLPLLRKAAGRFFAAAELSRRQEFWRFCEATFWLQDYALYAALKSHFNGQGWNRWPDRIRSREQGACEQYGELLGSDIGFHKYLQWQFSRQWQRLKKHANDRGLLIFGDAPIFVAHDSADVWCNQHIFLLAADGNPLAVAGVPPDYFSKTGQRWGNPLYNWEALAADDYSWWLARLRSDLALYDMLRIDHFRGFEACWEIPAGERTAVTGRWVKGPGAAFFDRVQSSCGELPIIAEDLGVITTEVEALRDRYAFPGMRILQFAFDSDADNSYLPHNHIPGCVAYTGTHDNDTTTGWFSAQPQEKQERICTYLRCLPAEAPWQLVRAALASVAMYAVIPLQDLLGLDSSARMNVPGVADGNWGWRMPPDYEQEENISRLRELTAMYNRIGQQ
jgi:4-alpha-glucanotransferase